MGMQTEVTGQCCGVGFSLHFTWVLGNGIQVSRPAWQEPPLTETAHLPTLFSRQGWPGRFEAHRLGWAANQPAPICLSAFSELGTSVHIKTSALPECCSSSSGLHDGVETLLKRAIAPVSGDGSKPDLPKISFFTQSSLWFSNHLLLYQLYKVNTEKKIFYVIT